MSGSKGSLVPVLAMIVLLCSVWAVFVSASGGAGDAAHFLRAGLGPRARAVGGAFTALGTDLSALFWNPSFLVDAKGARLGGAHESRFAGLLTVNHAAAALTTESLGAGLLWVSSDFYAVYQLAGAVQLGDAVKIGAAGKVYSFGEGTQRGTGVGVDIGAAYCWASDDLALSFGLSSRDIGWSRIRWDAPGIPAVDHVSWVTRFGTAVQFEPEFGVWTVSCDVEVALRRPPEPDEEEYLSRVLQHSVSLGVEVWVGMLAARAGIAHFLSEEGFGDRAQPSIGIGVVWGGISLDAAYVHTTPGYTYLLSMEYVFGEDL